MKVLFDTNIVLDLLLDREPFSQPAAELFSLVEAGQIDGSLGATTLTTVFYLAAKAVGKEKTRLEIRRLLSLCTVAPVTQAVLAGALDSPIKDFEDAVLHEAALGIGTEVLVTRNLKDFRKAKGLRVLPPPELLEILRRR